MIAKLKVECGFHFTQKLEGMFTDMKISADTMLAYKKHLETSTTVTAQSSSRYEIFGLIYYCFYLLGTRVRNFGNDHDLA